MNTLRMHAVVPHSRANGPGVRAVLWVQGCTLGCVGCFNPATHAPHAGETVTVDALVARIAALGSTIEGLTVSGGEPLQQRRPLLRLLHRVRALGYSVVVWTGYTWAEVQRMPDAHASRPAWMC